MKCGRTTADLRDFLWETMEGVRAGELSTQQAKAIAEGADKIIATAELELKYAAICSELDRQDQGISPGPILLTQQAQS